MDHQDDELQSEAVSETMYHNRSPGWVKFPERLLMPKEKLKGKGPLLFLFRGNHPIQLTLK